MTDLTVTTDAVTDARTRLCAAADTVTIDLRGVGADCGDPRVQDALSDWVGWLAMTSAALAGRISSAGRTATEAAGVLIEADQRLGREHAGTTRGVQEAR